MSAQGYLSSQGFQDPYQDPTSVVDYHKYDSMANADGSIVYEWDDNGPHGADSWWDKLSDALGWSHYDSDYEKYKDALNREYERQSTNSARAWDYWMDSTATQRRMKDIEAAGLNPWLALQSGGINANTSTQTASSGSSARSNTAKKDKQSALGYLLLAAAKVIAALI